ncbi:MAG: beta-N-acetylhexosaminidase [Chitinophagaceae bacterium]|nr:MAG: beta-N-acetylhexosaminidase [Chitinophagaceae bacterium]
MIKRIFTSVTILLFVAAIAEAQSTDKNAYYSIVPKPVSLVEESGFFKMDANIRILAPDGLKPTAELLKEELSFPDKKDTRPGIIRFEWKKNDHGLGKEGYRLLIASHEIRIISATKEGAIHGMFTLLQLQQIQPDEYSIPCLKITDQPRFQYRGFMLDVSRHFFPVSFVEKLINLMAFYKLNNLHLHLTDGAGWRIQIPKYPLLTSVAAWRPNETLQQWWAGDRRYCHEGDPDAYGGYYTASQIKGMVKYAAARGINIVPEIEMPAHSEEVLAVYPQLSCSGKPYEDASFCIGNDSTFTFLEDVLTEVMKLFPSKYIHIGGDEASMRSWASNPLNQALMKREGFIQVDQLQSYLVKKIEKFLTAHGRKLIGWDEILKGGLAPEATVMSWRGEAGGIAAARMGHDVIMTPGEYCYFDHYQSDPNTQPPGIGGYIPLRKVYSYDPVPEDSLTQTEKRHIAGVQANLWTEWVPTTEHAEYMIFPRLLALSEIAWTPLKEKDFDDFHRRMQDQYRLLQRHFVNYYRPSYRIHIKAMPDYQKKEYLIHFNTEQYNPVIHYTTDGSVPNLQSPVYAQPFYVSGITTIKATIFKNDQAMDSPAVYVADYDEAIGKKVAYNNGGWSSSYPAQRDSTLTNGIDGSLTYQDGQWQGFLHNMDVTIDMDSVISLNNLSIRFMQLIGPGVYMPDSVSVFLSDDNNTFIEAGTVKNDVSPKDPHLLFKTFFINLKGNEARYIRVKAYIQRGYMFTDEIRVN